jgi:MFS transporter, DHA1 family, tetracycline resistance protein
MAALYVIGFLSSLGFSIVIPFLVFLVTRFGGNAFVFGAIGAAFWAAQFVGSSWLGPLSDRLGRKRVLVNCQLGALAAWAVFLVAVYVPRVVLGDVDTALTGAFTITVPLVLIAIARVTDGLFNGSVSVANAYMADATTGHARKVGFARLGVANNLGFVIGPVIAGLLARTELGMVVVVGLALVLSGLAATLARFLLPDAPPQPATPVEVAQTGGVATHKLLGGGCHESVARPPSSVRTVLGIAALRPMIALYFLVFLGFSIFTAALPIHAATDLGWSSSDLGVLFTALALSLVATESVLLPALARRVSDSILGAAGSALVALGYVLMVTRSSPALYAGAILYGVGNGLSWPSYLSMLARSGPPQLQGTVQGVASSAGSLASVIGTLTSGVLYETIGPTTFFVSAAALVIATFMFVAAPRVAPE